MFTDDFIDAYIELKMGEVTRFRDATHPLDGHVLQHLRGAAQDGTAITDAGPFLSGWWGRGYAVGMRIALILAGLAVTLVAQSQEIYRWVDKNGVVHYSDQPDSPNAELISVIEPNAYEAQDAAIAAGGDAGDAGERTGNPRFRRIPRSRSSRRRRTRCSSARTPW